MRDKKGIVILFILLIFFGAVIAYLSIRQAPMDNVQSQANQKATPKDKVELLIESRKNAAGVKAGETTDDRGSKGTHRVVTDLEIEIAVLDRLIENNPQDASAIRNGSICITVSIRGSSIRS